MRQQKEDKNESVAYLGRHRCLEKTLDVHLRPTGESFQVNNTAVGISQRLNQLQPVQPTRIILEATGGREREVALSLTEADLPVVVINPRQARDFAQATGQLAKTEAIEAATYNHELLSINDLVGANVGCPEKEVTDCSYDRVVILGDSPSHRDLGKVVISTFKAVSEVEFSEQHEYTPQNNVLLSGWYSACFINNSRIWSSVRFLGGDKDNINEAWKIAKDRITVA